MPPVGFEPTISVGERPLAAHLLRLEKVAGESKISVYNHNEPTRPVSCTGTNVCVSTVVVSPDPLSLAPSIYSDMKTSGNMGQDHVDHELAYGGDIQMEYTPH